MALLDHFHPPLSLESSWHSLHSAWCTYLAVDLNRRLPEHCFATPNTRFGIEVDVATLSRAHPHGELRELATAPYLAEITVAPSASPLVEPWLPPPPVTTLPFEVMPEHVEVLVFNNSTKPTLIGAIELVCPANKDRPAQRTAFVSKCESHLRQGAGLVVVDIVTSSKGNLHIELLTRLGAEQQELNGAEPYATAYHPVEEAGHFYLELWHEELGIGQPLPILPLWLRGEGSLPINLQSTYQTVCADLRITMDRYV
jgi:hypothetical protein